MAAVTARIVTRRASSYYFQGGGGSTGSSSAHLWELVHEAYGTELGLTSDDDADYAAVSAAVSPSSSFAGDIYGHQPSPLPSKSKKQKHTKAEREVRKENNTKNLTDPISGGPTDALPYTYVGLEGRLCYRVMHVWNCFLTCSPRPFKLFLYLRRAQREKCTV